MSSSDAKNNSPQPAGSKPKALWQKPLLWIVAIVVAALAASLTDWIRPMFTGAINSVTETGEPITVRTEAREEVTDVSLPPEVSLSREDLAALDMMPSVEAQAEWMEKRGGVVVGKHSLTVTISGNRSDPVRVTDIRDASVCISPSRGTLVRLDEPAMAAVIDSVSLGIDVGNPSAEAWWRDLEHPTPQPYFPAKTIFLNKNEEQVLVIDLFPAPGQLCRPQLQMTVIHLNKEHKQQLVAESHQRAVMSREPYEAEQEYSQIYVGGRLCPKLVRVPPIGNSKMRDLCSRQPY